MEKRIVVTGLGCISPLGNDVASTWKNILIGTSGATRISHYDPADEKVQIAAEVKEFNPEEYFGSRSARKMDRFTQFAMTAAGEAIAHAGLKVTDGNRDRIGAVIGSGIGGVGSLADQFEVMQTRGTSRISPFMIPMMLPDTAAGTVAIEFGLRGPNMAVVTACASGTNAVGEAAGIIRRGDADVVLAGGAEAAIIKILMAGFGVMNAMTTRNSDPEKASRPFDKERDGFLIGEGAALLVIESLEHAAARGARILAEISGYGLTNDAFHITHPAENGAGAAICMQMALQNAGMAPESIEYINAHGTSTPLNDKSETAAIKTVFGDHAYRLSVSSTKSMTGHLLGASGAIEAIFCIRALQDGYLPPTINYLVPDPECDLDYIPNQAREQCVQHIMSNSFGFGGHNATIIFSRYQEAV
jgi:3-oxoacyl-[acyl-carrier-protein] synthase II